MKKIKLIYNTGAGQNEFKYFLDAIVEKFVDNGYDVSLFRTAKGVDLEAYVKDCADAYGIVVAGGDGTINRVVNIMMRNNIKIPLGVIPAGTSNDFATYLKLDTEEYFDRIAAGNTMKIDLGWTGEDYFINVASAGMVTSIAHEVNTRLKNVFGKMAYYVQGLKTLPQFKALDLRIKTDKEEIEEKAFLFLITNSSVVASFKNAAVQASVQDGLLDLIVIRQCNIAELMKLTAELMAGREMTDTKNVIYIQGTTFDISCDSELDSDLDGELGPKLPLHIEVVPKALEIFY